MIVARAFVSTVLPLQNPLHDLDNSETLCTTLTTVKLSTLDCFGVCVAAGQGPRISLVVPLQTSQVKLCMNEVIPGPHTLRYRGSLRASGNMLILTTMANDLNW